MISNEYINLLDRLEYRERNVQQAWDRFVYEYHNSGNIESALIYMAEVIYSRIAFTNNTSFYLMLDKARELHKRKNAGYSGVDNPDPWHNFRACNAFGISAVDGCITRMCDKYQRYLNVSSNPYNEQVHESINDTLEDLAAYALILVCLLREQNKPFDGLQNYEYAVAI